MTYFTRYAVLPFIRDPSGGLVAIEPIEAANAKSAISRASLRIGKMSSSGLIVGAIAFLQTHNAQSEGLNDPVILGRYGEAPEVPGHELNACRRH
jgi:hypothetical protein